jgi:hypothetical protein
MRTGLLLLARAVVALCPPETKVPPAKASLTVYSSGRRS